MTIARVARVGLVVTALLSSVSLSAHPISLTSGQATVGRESVRVTLEVLAEDFMMFYGLTPDQSNRIPAAELRSGMAQHASFLLRGFAIRGADGQRLEGQSLGVVPPSVAADGIAVGDLMDYAYSYAFSYPLATPPTHLTFGQDFGRAEIPLPAVLELEVVQQGIEAPDTVVLSNDGRVETFEFDWDQAADQGSESAAQAWQRRRQERREKQLGIGSYGAVYAFIYIQPYEVRVETLIPLLTLETWVQVERADREFLEVDEQRAAREPLERFLARRNVVKIDGVAVRPTLQRLDFYGVDFKDFAMKAPARRLSSLTARVGAILSYATKGMPRQVDIHWRLFNAAVFTARAAVYADQQAIRHEFTAYKPHYRWTRPGALPLPDSAAVDQVQAAGSLTATDAKQITGTLVRNIYRAFDYWEEEVIYDALQRSVHGDFLTELYLMIRKSLMMQQQGGAVSKVNEVNIVGSSITDVQPRRSQATVRLTWTVEGTVEHWGHIHTRTNQYEADFTIRAINQAWRIVGMELLNKENVRYQVNVRRLNE